MSMRRLCALLSLALVAAGGSCPVCRAEPQTGQPASPALSSGVTCPYLKQQASRPKVAAQPVTGLETSVLDKLNDLTKARHMLDEADNCCRTGNYAKAREFYHQVQQLCPGSRFDRDATERLKQIKNSEKVSPAGVMFGNTPTSALTPDLGIPIQADQFDKPERLVGQYLEGCHKAFLAGHYKRAEKLAAKALELDPAAVAASPLVYKCNLLRQLQDHARKCGYCLPFLSDYVSEDDQEPDAAEEESSDDSSEDEQAVRPCLPAIDPKIVDALEKVLAESADPVSPKMIILDAAPGGSEEQEDALAEWSAVPPPVEVPGLLGETETEDADQNPQPARDEEAAESEEPAPDANGLLREVVDALRENANLDIDTSREDCIRAECELEVGNLEFKLTWDESGMRCAVVRLLPDGYPDLRSRQRAHNDAVIDWITGHSGSVYQAAGSEDEMPELLDMPLEDGDDLY